MADVDTNTGRAPHRGLQVALLVMAVLATIHVPTPTLTWAWLLAVCAPAMILGFRGHKLSRSSGTRIFILLQVLAIASAWLVSGPLSATGFLCALLLPLLCWTASRARLVDVPIAVALGFCLTLTGILLRGEWSMWLLGLYAVATAHVFVYERDLRMRAGLRLRVVGARAPRAIVVRNGIVALALASLAVATTDSFLRLGQLVELDDKNEDSNGSGDRRDDTAPRSRKATGVSERFFLESFGPQDIETKKTPLCFVSPIDEVERPLPTDLYLRVSAFETPDPIEWLHVEQRSVVARRHRFRRNVTSTRRALLRGLPALGRFVPVATGVTLLRSAESIRVEPRAVLARHEGENRLECAMEFATRMSVPRRLRRDAELLTIPRAFRVPEFEALAREIPTGSLTATLEAVRTLLAERYSYVLADPEGPFGSALLDFMFASKRGYCMHFAGAAALLLRAKGIPCRTANGLYRGEVGSEAREIEAESVGAASQSWSGDPALRRAFGAQHAHAWVELPRADGAWFVFDPTPTDYRGLARARELAAEEALDDNEDDSASSWNIPWGILALLLAAILLRFVALRRVRASAGRGEEEAWVDRPTRSKLVDLLHALEKLGLEREPAESLGSFGRRVRTRLPGGLATRVEDAFDAYREIRYAAAPADAGRLERMQVAAQNALEYEAR